RVDRLPRRAAADDRVVPRPPRAPGVRICFFNRSYWPDQAATGQLLTELAEDLVAQFADEVTVVAGRALHGANGDDTTGNGIGPVTREEHRGVAIRPAHRTRP